LLVSYKNLTAQYYLDVPIIGQKNTQWCWAASMEMIDSFYLGTLTQGKLANKHQEFEAPDNTSDCEVPGCGTSPCNRAIDYFGRGDNIKPSFFDAIFNSFEYNSIEDIRTEKMDWINIKKEINACRPFILLLNKISPINIRGSSSSSFFYSNYNHALVSKGYYNYRNEDFSSQYILVNDPQNEPNTICDACEYLLPINIFRNNIKEFNSVLELVRFISPKDKDICNSCELLNNIDSINWISTIETSSYSDFFFARRDSFSNAILDSILTATVGGEILGELKYFDSDYLLEGLDEYVPSKKLKIVTATQTTPMLTVILEPFNNAAYWKVKSITKSSCTPHKLQIAMIPQESSLTDDDSDEESIILKRINNKIFFKEYTIIEYLPDYYIFYEVNYKGKKYLIPKNDYPKLSVKKEMPYKQKDIENTMRDVIDERLGRKKSCWFFRWIHKIFNK